MLLDTKLLRQKVLDLAIRGQLVPQLDSDEPAIHIIERICKKRNTKPTKLLSAPIEYDLPKGWVQSCIGDLFKLQSGKFIKGSEINDSISSNAPYACYGGNGIRGYVSTFNRDGAYPLLGRVGALCGNIKLAKGKFYATDNVTVVDHFNELDDKWVCYAFETFNLKQYANATAQPCISSGNLKNVPIYIPPLEEQKRIVAKVEEIFAELDAIDKAYSELEQLGTLSKSKILDLAIKGQLAPQLDSEPAVEQLGKVPEDVPFEIPEKWTFVKLSNISVKVHYGYTASAADKGNYKLLRITDISSGYVNWDTVPFCHVDEKAISKMKLAQNDLVIARSGASVGTAYLIKELKCDAVFASYLIRVIPKLDLVYPKYLEIFCKSPFYWKQIQKSSTGTAQLNVNAKSLNNLDLPLPPLEEQKRIVAKVEELFALIDAMKK